MKTRTLYCAASGKRSNVAHRRTAMVADAPECVHSQAAHALHDQVHPRERCQTRPRWLRRAIDRASSAMPAAAPASVAGSGTTMIAASLPPVKLLLP